MKSAMETGAHVPPSNKVTAYFIKKVNYKRNNQILKLELKTDGNNCGNRHRLFIEKHNTAESQAAMGHGEGKLFSDTNSGPYISRKRS